MDLLVRPHLGITLFRRLMLAIGLWIPAAVIAQVAGSPFETGANSMVAFLQTIGTPIAAIIIMTMPCERGHPSTLAKIEQTN